MPSSYCHYATPEEGSADFNLSNTNFAERVVFSLESTVSSPLDQDRFYLNLDKVISTAAQYFLGFGGAIPTNISALPTSSILLASIIICLFELS